MRVGKSVVDLEWRNEGGKPGLDVRSTGPAFRLVWAQTDGTRGEPLIPTGHTHVDAP